MFRATTLLCLASLFVNGWCLVSKKHKKHEENDMDFDLYIMSMSFQPEYCFQHRTHGYYYCENPKDTWRYNLTLHGLWPEYNEGSYPQTCTTEHFDEAVVHEIGLGRFETYWVNSKVRAGEEGYTDFWEHEWSKHGTCSGLGQYNYFDLSLNNVLKTPSIVSDNYGGTVAKIDLVDAYGGPSMVAILCNITSEKYLSEVRVCFGVEEGGVPTERIECPEHVLDEGNCADEIHLGKFYVDENYSRQKHFVRTGKYDSVSIV
mmetsp:Transcript_29329/g.43051  ORF Transcript_29329/g.43051 Transcript_29329/m.43051 type:complete len:260 (-) Transcript_29329:211-990(-)|eukprot:CAMPEP_0116016656 /NCGR_PEP_ID=MMETSP0321-20121206/7605_1 /TAXON_ID=163516 /ORGANISM="Leptocylindrus danicus var. danicus, Strain B650" /LENGTH=259 /DNA_ID=CAMNT_0003486745 /DNA_START=118 /DNA_END=897 /DNA_ORIENTATION=-